MNKNFYYFDVKSHLAFSSWNQQLEKKKRQIADVIPLIKITLNMLMESQPTQKKKQNKNKKKAQKN